MRAGPSFDRPSLSLSKGSGRAVLASALGAGRSPLRIETIRVVLMTELVQAIKLFQPHWEAAREHWRDLDPRMRAVTPPEPVDRLMEVTPTAFGALVRSVVHQQVSVMAGRAICGRLRDAAGGELDPARIAALSDDEMRAAGLSRGKVKYVRALAEAELQGGLSLLEELPDEEIHRRLIALPGIGIWT